MGVRNPNSTDYIHPDESNLLNLHKTMQYNSAGEPVMRTHVDGITLEGDVLVNKVKLNDVNDHDLVFIQPDNDAEPVTNWSIPAENFNMVFNGSSWDRMRGTINDGVLTQLSNDYLAISKDTNANSTSNPIYVNVTNTELEIKNDLNNPIPISKNTTPNSSANPINVAITSALDAGINSSIDSKGRLKVQTQESIFFNTFQYNKETDVWDESTVNGGSAVFNASQGLVDMSVTSTLGSKVVRQT